MKKIGLSFICFFIIQALLNAAWAQDEENFSISSCYVYELDGETPVYNGVAQAQVYAMQGGLVKYKGITGQYGGIEISLPRGQKFKLKIFKTGYDTIETPEYTVPTTDQDYGDEFLVYKQFFLPINLGPTACLKGSIIDGDGKYDGYRVMANHIGLNKSYSATIIDNTYEFPKLPLGDWKIYLDSDTLGIKNLRDLRLEGEASTRIEDIEIALVGINLKGRIYDIQDQSYLDGVNVFFIKAEDTLAKLSTQSIYPPPTYTQLKGIYEYKGFKETGSIRILAVKAGYQSKDTSINIDLQGFLDQHISQYSLPDIKLNLAKDTLRVHGKVQYYQNAIFSLKGVQVELWNHDSSVFLQKSISQEDGSFEIKHYAYLSDKFYIKVKAEGFIAFAQEKKFNSFNEEFNIFLTPIPKPMYSVVHLVASQLLNSPHIVLTWQKDDRAQTYKVERYTVHRKSADDAYFNSIGVLFGKDECIFVDTSAKYDIQYQYKVDVTYAEPSGVAYYGNDSARSIRPQNTLKENLIDVESAYVYEEGAAAIFNARVYAIRRGKVEAVGYTDQNGSIVLSLEDAQYYQLNILKKGFLSYTSDSILSNEMQDKSFYLKPDYGETIPLLGTLSFADGDIDGMNLLFYHNETDRTFRTEIVNNFYFFPQLSIGSGRLTIESDTLGIEGGGYLYVSQEMGDTMKHDIKIIRDGINVYGYTYYITADKKINNIEVCLTQGLDTLFHKVSDTISLPPNYERENGYYSYHGLRRGGNVKMSAYGEAYASWDTSFNLDVYQYVQDGITYLRLPDVRLHRVKDTIEQKGSVLFQNPKNHQLETIEGAIVELWSADTTERLAQSKSDGEGKYKVSYQGYIVDQKYILLVKAEGFNTQYIPLEFSSFSSTYDIYMSPAPILYYLNVYSNDTNWGSVSGGGIYQEGDSVHILATPKSGYKFLHWNENNQILSTEANYGFRIRADKEITAEFKKIASLESLELESISVFSSENTLIIRNPQSLYVEIFVVDLLGRELYQGKIRENLYISMPNTGIYIVRLIEGIHQVTHKIFVR